MHIVYLYNMQPGELSCSMDMQTAAIAVRMLKLICSTQNPPTLRSVRVKVIYKFHVPVGMARMK